MILYLLKTTTCLFLCWAFYRLVLEKEKMSVFNRFYLLGSLVLSLLFPFFVLNLDSVAVNRGVQLVEAFNNQMLPIVQMTENWKWNTLLFWLYGGVTLLLLIRFLFHIRYFHTQIQRGKLVKKEEGYLVLMPSPIIPYAFFQYVFVHEEDYLKGNINRALLIHEFAHIKQWHSLDILLVELVGVFFWFNPMIYAYKKVIRLNHEFLADDATLKTYKDIVSYQKLLLSLTSSRATSMHLLANSFNYSITKKRLKMMRQNTATTMFLFKGGLVMLLAILTLFLFSAKIYCKLPYLMN